MEKWIRSSACKADQPMCVEVSRRPSGTYIRDSKDPDGPELAFTNEEFDAFCEGVRRGDFA